MTEGPRTMSLYVWSNKGGVGKSTVAKAITRGLKARGLRVGHFDADLTGPSAPTLFGADARLRIRNQRIQPAIADGIPVVSTGLLADADHPYIWHGPLLRGALHQLYHDTDWGPLELLVIDMPPGTGETQLAVIDEFPCLGTVIVTTPHELALVDVRRSLRMLQEAGIPVIAIIENMAAATCPRCAHTWQPFPGTAGDQLHHLLPHSQLIKIPVDDGAPALDGQGNGDTALIRHLDGGGLFTTLSALHANHPAATTR
ncbi:P-loop NTPase [Streptomyces sp. AV19]|uniref:P-loop NTPase n=1 Tax=Streptomyces sp. AV19 TaxID=2793068 RepID=UPI0018FEE29B|nr:P-loop NTPase [Streptomyces sp. AV19]MBH1937791.1 P-loop NTPase [Streptomyces sp. AV19]MDG4537067.1 Mrp/NBP35 family ATP-binding protein [Streptomyces sp. AV19]